MYVVLKILRYLYKKTRQKQYFLYIFFSAVIGICFELHVALIYFKLKVKRLFLV